MKNETALNWMQLRQMRESFPIDNIGVSYRRYQGDFYKFGQQAYACAQAWNFDGIEQLYVSAIYWVPCEAAFRRLAMREVTYSQEVPIAPPGALLLKAGCLAYREILKAAETGKFGRCAVFPEAATDKPKDKIIHVENVDYHFRIGTALGADEPVYAITVVPDHSRWSMLGGRRMVSVTRSTD